MRTHHFAFVLLLCGLASLSKGAVFTNSTSADSFVRANAPTSNYGGAGADSISGSGGTNGSFDTFIRFNTFSMMTNLNALYGSNRWVITNVTLQVTEQGAPNNALFNRGKGAFEIRWTANDNWVEGTGNPTTPGATGIVYTNEPGLLNALNDASLGTYTNAGVDGLETFALPLASSLIGDIRAGGEVGFFMTAADENVGFTFSSRSFSPASGRPYLLVSAVPKPAIASVATAGPDLLLSCTNGIASGTYKALVSADATLPLNQWLPIATTTISNDGAFQVVITNALVNPQGQQFYSLQMQ